MQLVRASKPMLKKQGLISVEPVLYCCCTYVGEWPDIRFLQAFIGHKDLNMTEIYTCASPKNLREVYSQTHPVEIIGTRH